MSGRRPFKEGGMSDRAAARRSDFVGSKALLKRCFALAKLEFINTNFKKTMRFGNIILHQKDILGLASIFEYI